MQREWTLRFTIWFTEGEKAEILGHFSRPRRISPAIPDVAEADVNALLHYETKGRLENRTATA